MGNNLLGWNNKFQEADDLVEASQRRGQCCSSTGNKAHTWTASLLDHWYWTWHRDIRNGICMHEEKITQRTSLLKIS